MASLKETLGDMRLLHRLVLNRPYLALAIGFGVLVGALWPAQGSWMRQALVGWNAGVWSYLLGMTWLAARADHGRVREIARRQDESAGLVLATLLAGAGVSLYAIISELTQKGHVPAHDAAMRYAFTALTVIGTWLLVGVLFCFHYAHVYYRDGNSEPPLRFPQEEFEPDYWDFLYFSFTIAVAVQTSDVAVASRTMRKLVLGQSVLAFFFNLLILGLSINIAAGLIDS
jgi:uncharacterized membrane protein